MFEIESAGFEQVPPMRRAAQKEVADMVTAIVLATVKRNAVNETAQALLASFR